MTTGYAERLDTQLSALSQGPATRAAIAEQLARLGEHLGITDLTLDEDGMLVLEVDGLSLSLIHVEGSTGLTASAPLVSAESLPDDLLVCLLQANGDWTLTRGGVVGIDPDGPSGGRLGESVVTP